MSSKLNERLQIIAAVSIVVSLLLVGVQLNQNSELLKTQLLYEESNRMTAIESRYIGENPSAVWAKSIEDPESLTLAEQRIVEALLWTVTEQWRATRMLAELGLLEEAEWRPRVASEAGLFLGNRYGRAWWENYAGNVPPELADAINERLGEVGPNYTGDNFRTIMDTLRNREDGTTAIPE
jgi:hypothetical protein